MLQFNLFNWDVLFEAFDVPHGFIIDSNMKPRRVVTMADVEGICKKYSGSESAKTIEKVIEDAGKAGLLPEFRALFQCLAAKASQDTDMAGLSFKLCVDEDCLRKQPHGNIQWNGRDLSKFKETLGDVILYLCESVHDEEIKPDQAVVLLKQAMDVEELPLDMREMRERFPEAVDSTKALEKTQADSLLIFVLDIFSALTEKLGPTDEAKTTTAPADDKGGVAEPTTAPTDEGDTDKRE